MILPEQVQFRMINNELDLSRLKTISSFDRDTPSTMAVGVPQPPFSPSSLLVESLVEQICKLMEKDPSNQRQLYLTVCGKLQQMNLIGSSYNIEEFQFMRTHYQKSLYKLLLVARQTMMEKKAICPSIFPHISVCSEHLQEPSRYSTEFIELDFIAKGGFGSVFKAKHKLDGGIYAVKKILLRYRNLNSFNNNLMEVKMLAKLNHPNIVAYKAAWLEPVDGCTFDDQYQQPSAHSTRSVSSVSVKVIESEVENDSLEVVFEKSCQTTESPSSGSHSSHKIIQNAVEKVNKSRYEKKIGKHECAMLYIQMQYCNQTLRQWIDNRNHSRAPIDIDVCINIFKQIVTGLQYIHSQNIVHHDIKPSNIFVSEDNKSIQVGDFGLACGVLHGTECGILEGLLQVVPHRPGRIGTELYAAPEQLDGYCHAKSDIFSLGVVLFELMVPFHTSMERVKVIGELKKGVIPQHIDSTYPLLAKVLRQMVNKDCNKRPSATDLLTSLEELENHKMYKIIKQQEKTIQILRQESIDKDKQIALLQKQLKMFMSRDNT